ncbi:hypothetical protein HPB47_028283 [Ixodes persulcatus]|uniref:Uncharacterized protein n=1 Tax=Ixodes persulcatus TaxID=34615 RepID=A0AC60PTM0_IXOPE|nr:hypothetical protein HPB47_028283 [Ixodes persulcatus]
MSFNVEQLGLTRADAALPPILQPPPAYPPLEFSPAPLVNSEENIYLAALLRDQRRNMFESGFNVQPLAPPQLVERTSLIHLRADLSYFPAELRSTKKVKKRPKVSKPSKAANLDVQKKLQALEETEAKAGSAGEEEEEEEVKKEPGTGEEEGEEEEELDEEEMEEETDYASGYFDNGESYLDEEDDNLDDGPVY